jgi:sugar phosphate isomerase/epimerase
MVKDLHPNMGMCFDIGHQFRDNRDPADAIYKYHTRIFDVHLKNVSDNSKKGKAEPLPRGKMDLVEIAQALKNVGYTGCCSLEFERNFTNNYAEIAECIGYFRGVMDSLR